MRLFLDVRLEEETVWLSQAQISKLFGIERSVITKHLNNVFKNGELRKMQYVQFLHILLLMEKFTKRSFITWMQ